jgi:curved DNA-binding protein
MTEEEVSAMFGGQQDGSFSDFFRTFFGGAGPATAGDRRGRAPRTRHRPGRDVEQTIELGLEDALNGIVQRLGIQHDGQMRTVEVRIPAGVTEGSRVRVAGEGERGTGTASSGDLYLRVHLRPHPQFERRGRDLYAHVKVPVTTAVLGGEVNVPTLGGRTVRLKVPPTTQNGQTFRMRGHGLPAVGKPDDRGELYVTVDVTLPTTLSPDARQHYEALRAIEGKA